jgi:hypothetical protein
MVVMKNTCFVNKLTLYNKLRTLVHFDIQLSARDDVKDRNTASTRFKILYGHYRLQKVSLESELVLLLY